jgi:Ion transport protein
MLSCGTQISTYKHSYSPTGIQQLSNIYHSRKMIPVKTEVMSTDLTACQQNNNRQNYLVQLNNIHKNNNHPTHHPTWSIHGLPFKPSSIKMITNNKSERTPLLQSPPLPSSSSTTAADDDIDDVPVMVQQQDPPERSAAAAAAAASYETVDWERPPLPLPPHDRIRKEIFQFLEAQTPAGKYYEVFIIVVIFINVLCFIVGSVFVPTATTTRTADHHHHDTRGWCQEDLCDAIFFGNYVNNGLQFLNIGSTCLLELCTVLIFTIEYILRLYTADLINPHLYSGLVGRIRYLPTFFSIIDLISTVPFYIDAFVFPNTDYDVSTTAYLRMFRLFRMMRVEGRYDTAFTLLDDVFWNQKDILCTAGFVGVTVWIVVSSLYYLTERTNYDMIYCPLCTSYDDSTNTTTITTDTFDPTTDCIMDDWGIVDCTSTSSAGGNDCTNCYHRYESIPMASYYALLNLLGEYPLIDQHSFGGKIVGTITAVAAVAVFALPVGIIGNGLEIAISKQRKRNSKNSTTNATADDILSEETRSTTHGDQLLTPQFCGNNFTFRGRMYNVFHSRTIPGATALELFINLLIIATTIAFMIDTVISDRDVRTHVLLDSFEFVSVIVFTVEYCFRVYSIKEDPKYNLQRGDGNRFTYMCSFLSVADLLSFAPYWIEMILLGGTVTSTSSTVASNGGSSNVAKSLRLLRIFRFERYTHAFTTFDDVFLQNIDILAVTAFTAFVFWIFFSTCLYFTERYSLDEEMASNYNTIPNSMWITLLNLSGECPLCQYSLYGKMISAMLALFATSIFGIPIGVLGAGFEAIVSQENQDNVQELSVVNLPQAATVTSSFDERNASISSPTSTHRAIRAMYQFVNGVGSIWAQRFELMIYALIVFSVAVGAWQTVDGHENDFHEFEWFAVIVFTIEYTLRFIGAGADPEFVRSTSNHNVAESVLCRLRFMISFYSVIDLLAIVPFYVAFALPNTVVNDYDEYFRMLRIVRLLKLDKYVPSITLIGT